MKIAASILSTSATQLEQPTPPRAWLCLVREPVIFKSFKRFWRIWNHPRLCLFITLEIFLVHHFLIPGPGDRIPETLKIRGVYEYNHVTHITHAL